MTEEFLKRVTVIAKYKYDLNEDILEEFLEEIEACWYNDFTPIRTVEFVANKIF